MATPHFPVPRLAEQLVLEWAPALAARFGVDESTFRSAPARYMDYPNPSDGGCRVELMDGSVCEFRWAFAIASPEQRTVAVFTEHSGVHLFPLAEARVFESGRQLFPPSEG
jgi:hypothetical protein